jgi:hypothetical protein
MNCRICYQASIYDLCNICRQRTNYLEKYPILKLILTPSSLDLFKEKASHADIKRVDVICTECNSISNVDLMSILKYIRRKLKANPYSSYKCHPCSKRGSTNIGLKEVLSVIDVNLTNEKYGGLSKNLKKGFAVVKCEDCGRLSDVKCSSLLHGARRHLRLGRSCLYKCFDCGVKLPDALAKSYDARAQLLASGARSYIEVALANRLNLMNIKYEEQYKTDMYVWDFFLPDYSLLIDVNGEYFHGLPRNVSKDKSKLTYISRYLPHLKTLIIEEKRFLNPLMVDKIIEEAIGKTANLTVKEFIFSDVKIESQSQISKSKRSLISDFLTSYHYSGFGRNGKFVITAKLDDLLIAICKFNTTTRQSTASSLGYKCYEVLELDRFCIHPLYHKKNFASWFLSRCMKMVFESNPLVNCLVSFADPTYGHSGTIYKAANWISKGKTNASYHYMDHLGVPINKKRVYDFAQKLKMKEADYVALHGLEKYKELPKNRFIFKRT